MYIQSTSDVTRLYNVLILSVTIQCGTENYPAVACQAHGDGTGRKNDGVKMRDIPVSQLKTIS